VVIGWSGGNEWGRVGDSGSGGEGQVGVGMKGWRK